MSRRFSSLYFAAPLLLIAVLVFSTNDMAMSARSFSKSAMLEDLASRVIIAGYAEFGERARAFRVAANDFAGNPGVDSLERAQQKWVDAMLAWRSAQVFRNGPLIDSNILSRIHFWPIRRQSIDKVLQDSRAITPTYVSELGAPAVGLCALEHLLFDPKSDDEAVLATYLGANNERRRFYLRTLANDLVYQAERVTEEWTRKNGYKEVFVRTGQESLNLVVNDMVQALEIATEERLKYAISLHENNLLRPEFIQGSLSRTSQRGLLNVLLGAHRLYQGEAGFGLKDHLHQIKSPLAQRIELQFEATLKAVDGIKEPLEHALFKDRQAVLKAYEECKKLEIVLKVDMVSALGVTLTFNSTDGD